MSCPTVAALVWIVLAAICGARENVSMQILAFKEQNVSLEFSTTESSIDISSTLSGNNYHGLTTVGSTVTESPRFEEGFPDVTQPPSDTDVLPLPPDSETKGLPEETNTMDGVLEEESNHLNEIFDLEDELLNSIHATVAPTFDKLPEEIPGPSSSWLDLNGYTSHTSNYEYSVSADVETDTTVYRGGEPSPALARWKIGAISAAAFVIIQATILLIYCFTCRRKKLRISRFARSYDDSEAGETINAESNENTVTKEDEPCSLTPVDDGVEPSIPNQQDNMEYNTEPSSDLPILDTNSEDQVNHINII